MKKIIALITATALTATLLTGCSSTTAVEEETATVTRTFSTSAQSLSTTIEVVDRLELSSGDLFSANAYEVGYISSIQTSILLSDGSSTASADTVSIDGDSITITAGGTYLLSGSLSNGQIVVDCEEDVQLILDGVTLSNVTTAPIYVVASDNTYITTTSDSANLITATLVEDETAETNVDATIFSHDDLILNGQGTLTINAVGGNGITSKDDLVFTSGTYSITADKHGIEANDSIRVAGGSFNIIAEKDGLHCENEDDTAKGYIYIANGTFIIEAMGDGIDSSSQIQIEDGNFTITAGGGYDYVDGTTSSNTTAMSPLDSNMQTEMGSMPGRTEMSGQMSGQMGGMQTGQSGAQMATMADSEMQEGQLTGQMPGMMGGTMQGETEFTVDPEFSREMPGEIQETIGTTPEMTDPTATMGGQMGGRTSGQMGQMTGGAMGGTTTTQEDDSVSAKGIKADSYLILSEGIYQINALDDALHGNMGVDILGGTYVLQTSDDAIHSDLDTYIGGGTINITACYEGLEGERVEVAGGIINIKSNDDGINASISQGSSGDVDILITGGSIFIDCDYEGDGFDSNGTILMTGGSVLIYGTTTTTDTTLDYSGSSAITGGTFVATGSAGQTLQNFGEDSTQGSILVQLSSFTTGEIILTDGDGNVLVQTTPTKSYQAVIISSPDILVGETYTLIAGDYTETIEMDTLIYGAGNEHSNMMGGQMSGQMGMSSGMQGGQMGMSGGMQGGMGGGR